MSRQFKCSWCKNTARLSFIDEHNFTLEFTWGTYNEDTGPSLEGYEVQDLCDDCAIKLKEELIKLGIEIREIDV